MYNGSVTFLFPGIVVGALDKQSIGMLKWLQKRNEIMNKLKFY
ncbi:hypothetical protein ACFSGI_05520 [Paenibacillus nicotianae]|uniref:Uncharacterized protein n=1 Tax=Paenibacillus nicotianae TaxID=1526551 RepID=A0ABW4UPD7_9BACL